MRITAVVKNERHNVFTSILGSNSEKFGLVLIKVPINRKNWFKIGKLWFSFLLHIPTQLFNENIANCEMQNEKLKTKDKISFFFPLQFNNP